MLGYKMAAMKTRLHQLEEIVYFWQYLKKKKCWRQTGWNPNIILRCLDLALTVNIAKITPAEITPAKVTRYTVLECLLIVVVVVEVCATVHFILVCQRLFGDNLFINCFFLAETFRMCVNVFLYNQEQNFSLIRQKMRDPHYKNRPFS